MADMLMPLQIQRQYASSLDADYEFATLEELKEYATTSALSYSGQVLYCKVNDTLYKVNAAKTAVEAIGEGGGGGTNTYTTLAELGLTADATFQDVVDTLPEGGSALLGVTEFTNYQTIFPYEEGNDQFARVHIVKGAADGSRMYARWFRKDGIKEAIAIFNIDDNKFGGWRILKDQQIYTSLTELGLTADATVEDVVSALKNGESFLVPVNIFTNYTTIFPNKVPNDQWNKVHIVKGTSLASSHIRCFSPSGTSEYLANINNASIVGWIDVSGAYIDISDAVIEKLGTEILKYPVGKYRINSTATGNKFTDLPSEAQLKCGLIEVNGTAVGKSPFTDAWVYRMYKFETLTGSSIYTRKLNSGATAGQIEVDTGWCKVGQETFTTLEELGLTADATIDNVRDALKVGESCIIRTDAFTDLTQFNGIQWGYLKITTTVNGMSEIWLNDVTSPNGLYYGRQSSGKFYKWVGLSTQRTYTELVQLGLTADATIDDIIAALQDGETALISTNEFTNYKESGMFPNYCSDDAYAVIKIEKEAPSKVFIEWRQKAGNAYAIGGLNSSNKFTGWGNIVRFKKDGYADDSIVCIGDTASADGVIQTLTSLGFTTDVMTWDTGVYRVSHVSELTNLPSDIVNAAPGFRLEHYDCKKWGANHNPNKSTWAIRHSVLYADNGNVYHRYTESGATAGVYAKDTGWQKIQTTGSNVTLVANTQTLKLDITKKNSSWYGAIKLTYLFDTSLVEAEIDFRSATDTLKWAISKGQKYIKKITYTQDANNKAHYTIGIEFSGTTYGCYQAEVVGGFADINSLTKDAFTGDTTAVYGNIWGKNNGVTLVTAPEDLGLTSPCTTVQLAQAMRNTFNKTINSGAIGVFNNGGSTITDAPSDYGLLHIETFGHDRIMIRYDGISSSTYAGSWVGQIKGSNGTFSGITWAKIGTDNSIPGRYVADISGSAITIKMTRHDPVKQGIMKIQYNKWITTATYDTRTIELSINPNFPRYTGSHPDEITSVTYNWSGSTATDCSICISLSGSFNPYVIVDMDPTYATINSVTNASTALAYTANPMKVSSSTSKTFSNSDVLAADTEIILQPGSGTSLSSSGYEIKNGICYFVVNIQTSSGGTYKPSTTYKVVQLPVPLRYPVAADINGRIYTEISDNKAWVEGDGILRVVMTHTAATYHNLYVSGSYPVK